jgi:integrase
LQRFITIYAVLSVSGGEKQKPKDGTKLKFTSKGTVNRELAVLSHLFNKAIEWGWMPARPAKIRRYQEDVGRIIYLTIDQIKTLVECAKADQNAQVYPFIVIGLETSMRKSEILSIRREHVDIERQLIFIPKAKAGMREQPITKHLAKFLEGYLAALPKGTPWLFPSIGAKEGHTVDVRKAYRRTVEAAGLNPDEVVRHTLRHTAITHLVQSGVDLPTVKRISGHKTLIMVERYAHQNGAHIQTAMDKLEKRMKIA